MKAYNRAMGCNMEVIGGYFMKKEVRLIYSDMNDKLAKLIRRRAKNHHQSIIVISGGTGSGKSTEAVILGNEVNPEWDIEGGYVYGADDLRAVLSKGRRPGVINFFDEGSVSLNSLNFNRGDDKGIVTMLDILRSWEMTTIICIPCFFDLNSRVRAHLVDFWIHCPEKPLIKGRDPRDFFEVYSSSHNQWSTKVYWNFLGAGTHGPLRGDIEETYERIKYEHQMAEVTDFIEKGNKKGGKK